MESQAGESAAGRRLELAWSQSASKREAQLKQQAAQGELQHSCSQHRRPQLTGNELAKRQQQLVESLRAPRSCLAGVSVEPFAFLAIVALYVEFPSIQDLIYTRICLDVVAERPQLLLAQGRTSILTNNSSQLSSVMHLDSNVVSSLKLDEASRIQTLTSTSSTSSEPPSQRQDALLLCDRFDKSQIPVDVRSQIADLDSLFWLKYQIIICLLTLLSCPYWGGVSDRLGRLLPLNVPVATSAFYNLLPLAMGLAIHYELQAYLRIECLYLVALLVGLSGGQAVLLVNSFSLVSDTSNLESRSKRITVLETSVYLAHSVGYLLSRALMSLGVSRINSSRGPWTNRHFCAFLTCILLNLAALAYSALRLRHKRHHRFLNNFEREHRDTVMSASSVTVSTSASNMAAEAQQVDRTVRELTLNTPDDLENPLERPTRPYRDWRTIVTLRYFRDTLEAAVQARDSRPIVLSLLLCGFISATMVAGQLSLLYAYLRTDPFNWTTSQYSLWNFVNSLANGLALLALSLCMRFLASWNVPDPLVSALGFFSKALGLLLITLAHSSTLIHWSLLALVCSEFGIPPIRTLLSKLVSSAELAKLYSCLAVIQSVCFLAGNLVFYFGLKYLDEVQRFHRLSFGILSALQFFAFFIMIWIYTALRSRPMII